MAKWIEFVEIVDPKRKTKIFCVVNKESRLALGAIKWYGGFRKYSFFPLEDVPLIFESQCLRDLADFLDALMEERKKK